MRSPRFVVGPAEVWLAWVPHLQLASEMGAVSWV